MHASPALIDDVQALMARSRQHPGVRVGLSPRAGLALLRASRAFALLQGRSHVLPEDVRSLRYVILRHRVLLTFEAEADGVRSEDLIDQIFDAVPTP